MSDHNWFVPSQKLVFVYGTRGERVNPTASMIRLELRNWYCDSLVTISMWAEQLAYKH